MVGFVVVTHHKIGQEMLETVQKIVKEKSNILCVEIKNDPPFTEAGRQIHEAIQSFRNHEGVIILTDLFGATPSNLCKEYLKNGKVEMITGCNLPMLIKAATTDFKESPAQVAQFLKNYAKDNIRVYSTDY